MNGDAEDESLRVRVDWGMWKESSEKATNKKKTVPTLPHTKREKDTYMIGAFIS